MSFTILPLAWHAWAGGGGSWGFPWFFVFSLLWLCLLGAIAVGAVFLVRARHPWRQAEAREQPAGEASVQHARAILHERYARGDISTEEYRERMEQLS
ncbi:MAG: SHOCT domain-containing protein [Candidatus Dormibacteraceae bacterium]